MPEMFSAESVAKDLKYYFHASKGYTAIPTKRVRSNGKKEYDYLAIKEDLAEQHYLNHLQKDQGLTPSPIYEVDQCCWGAVDVDIYNLDDEAKIKIIKRAIELELVPAFSKSGGLHLWCFAKEEIPSKHMRNYLCWVRDELDLDSKTEIFPKQLEVITEPDGKEKYGNGITIPYRGWYFDPDNSPTGINLYKNKIIKLPPFQFIQIVKTRQKHTAEFKKYEDYVTAGDKDSQNKKKFYAGEHLDINRKGILKAIKEKQEHPDGGTFDNWVTLYVAKSVRAMETDDAILEQLEQVSSYSDKATKPYYFEDKIRNCRKTFGIEDPKIAREKILQDVVYIMSRDKFFDISTNDEYKKEAIDFKYARYFKNTKLEKFTSCSQFIKINPHRKVVEDWLYDPKQYAKDKKIITVKGKFYLNAYEPNDLDPEQGDTKLLHELLNHYFNAQDKYKNQFLDWWAYQIQSPGEKIRYAMILHSTFFQVGKGSIWRAMKLTFGSHNAKEIDVGQAIDKSKGYLTNSQLVLIDEMQSAGDFNEKMKLLNHLKRIITEDSISSRALFIDYKIVQSCTNYLLFTNHKDALSLPPNEVRYWVFMSDRERMTDDFYKRYHKWLDDGGAKAILYELKNRKISEEFQPKGIAPFTPWNKEMSSAGAHPLSRTVKALVDEQERPFEEEIEIVSSMQVFEFLKAHRLLGRSRINDVKTALEFVGGRYVGQVRVKQMVGNEVKIIKPTLYVIRNHKQYDLMEPQEIASHYKPFPYEWIEPKKNGGHF